MGPRTFSNRLKKFKTDPLFQEEMLKHTDNYLDYIAKTIHSYDSPPYVAIEKRLDYSTYAPEGFGTGDCIIIGGDTMHIIDFKYGKGVPVSATNNPQMKLYALGAYTEYSFLYPIKTIKMTIVQPRLDNISEDAWTIESLLAWGEGIKSTAQKAFKGEGEYFPGEHCKFCRAKALCRARTEFNASLEDEYKEAKPPLISNEEVGKILEKAKHLAAWAKDLEEYALSECLKGNDIPGWKAVHGRGSREFTDQDKAFEVLEKNGIDEAMLYERKPLTLAAAEKLVGKPKFKELLSDYILSPPGKPTLVVMTDKREPIKTSSAEDDFKNN